MQAPSPADESQGVLLGLLGNACLPLAGTIFQKSTTPLKSWFYAMYLIGSMRCGISAKQLEREPGVTYKTAWLLPFRKLEAPTVTSTSALSGTITAKMNPRCTLLSTRSKEGEARTLRSLRTNRLTRKTALQGGLNRGLFMSRSGLSFSTLRLDRSLVLVKRLVA